jgi:hypothetical protein
MKAKRGELVRANPSDKGRVPEAGSDLQLLLFDQCAGEEIQLIARRSLKSSRTDPSTKPFRRRELTADQAQHPFASLRAWPMS